MRHKVFNLAALVTIQVSNAVLPLLIFPFTLGMVGADLYSKIVFSEALALFLLAVVLYSFEVDGVAQVVALDKKDVEQLSRIFSSIIYLRILLFICAAPLMIVAAFVIDKQLVALALCWALVPLSYAIQPSWLYQGLEQNMPVAIFTALSRTATVVIIFTVVNSELDYVIVPLTIGGIYMGAAICTLLYAMYRFNVRFVHVAPRKLMHMLVTGKEVFLGNVSVILYRDANVIVLTLFGTSGAGIAAYSMAEKLVKAIQAGIRPLNQLFFPRALRLAQVAGGPHRLVFRQLLKITIPQLGVLAAIIIGLIIIIYSGIGEGFLKSQHVENIEYVAFLVMLMSAATFFGVSNFMFGSAGLNALGERRYLLIAMVCTGLISLISTAVLVYFAGALGASISFVLAEALLLAFITKRYFQ